MLNVPSLLAAATLVVGSAAFSFAADAHAATDVDFGPNVLVLDPGEPGAQARLDTIFATQERGQFNDKRYAVLLKPGEHHLNVDVGFYTQILGLGAKPDDVTIDGTLRSTAHWMRNNNATCNFWRAAENLAIRPTADRGRTVWAVSQATAWRRVHLLGDVNLWDGGWSSGGYFADCRFDGTVASGSQQQWFSRNCDWRKWDGGAFNMVFVGVPTAPAGEWPQRPFTTVAAAPVIREKPYLTLGADGKYAVIVPPLRQDAAGPTWPQSADAGRVLDLSQFYVARPDRDSSATINAALDAGKHLLLTPGTYELTDALRVTRPGTVVMGLGYATLRPTRGTAAITVADVDGVTVAGLLLEASAVESPELLQVGPAGSNASHVTDPTLICDVYTRAGGAIAGRCHAFVTINSKNVIADHFWLWRADHGAGAKWDQNPVANGLVVNGDDVTVYGLFVEHTQEYQTLWNGDGGRMYFYQSEFPYDPPSQAAWGNGGHGWASYKVADGVTTHEAFGLGMYGVFPHGPIVVQNAAETPETPGVRVTNVVTTRFTGQPGSGVAHAINGQGGFAGSAQAVRVTGR